VRTATPDAYFERCWGDSDDPWAHARRWSETRKYRLTVAALPRLHYGRSFEPGCGIGVLTTLLAARSDAHLAMERHERGVSATRQRCAGLPEVTVARGRIPDDWPEGAFDLIVLSEVLYYLSSGELADVLDRVEASLAPGGDLVAVHHRPTVPEHTWTGDEVHERLRQRPGWTGLSHLVEDGFVLDVLRR